MEGIEKMGNPVLREKAKEVPLDDAELRQIVEDMKRTLKDANGLGLAANQVGLLKKIFIYDIGEGPQVMINPRIVWKSEEKTEDTEGCLSIPNIEVIVERAASVRVEALDMNGKKKLVEAEGLLARVMQHEMDHLDGTLIIDRTSDEQRREAMKKFLEGD